MANVWSGDSDIVLVMNFEDGALTTDETGNHDSGDWSNVGNPTAETGVATNIGDGGSYSAEFIPNENFYIDDADLCAGFPCKSSGGSTTFSFCAWVKCDDLNDAYDIVSKYYHTDDDRNFRLNIIQTTGIVQFVRGYDSGQEYDAAFCDYGTGMSAGVWYHIALCYNDTTGAYYLSVWDDSDGEELGVVKSGTDSTYNISSTTERFRIGSRQGASYMDGRIDELVVAKKYLTPTEIAAIRAGTFGASGGGLEMEIAMHHYTKNIGM
ncbi:MAG: LamG domain-containing protein [Planctomycetes bacterium]|nr:LamG domain-containing protein [Planctomycetota bacterium]